MNLKDYFIHLLKWTAIGAIIATAFGLIWAIAFWNSSLFWLHWLSVPLYFIIVGVGAWPRRKG